MTTTGRTIGSMTWWEYVQSVTRGVPNVSIADRVQITPSAVGKWKDSTPRPAQVAAFAKAFGRPVLEAFVYAGILDAEDVEAEAAGIPARSLPDPSQLDDEALIAEIRRRFREGGSDARQAEAEKMILTDGGTGGTSETGGAEAAAGQRGTRRVTKGRGGMKRTPKT